MANRFAIANGDFGDTAIWSTTAGGAGGASVPGVGDSAMANGKTVQITTNVTCTDLRNDTQGSATAGGYFNCATAGVTITANVVAGGTAVASNGCLSVDHVSGTVSIVGQVRTGTANSSRGLYKKNFGTLSIVGDILHGTTASASAIGVYNEGSGAINITGAVDMRLGGNGATGVSQNSTGAITITGSVYAANVGGASSAAVITNSSGVISIVGAVYGTASGASCAVLINNAAGFVAVTGALYAGLLPAIISLNGGVAYLSGPFVCSGAGIVAVVAYKWLWLSSAGATYMTVRTESTLAERNLYTADSVGGNPAIADVREGTAFGPADELTGTLAVPPAGSVALGVPVDAGTGTAVLTPAALLGADLLARLEQCATVETTGAQIAAMGGA